MAPSLSKNAPDVMGLLDSNTPLSITLEGSNFLANGHPVLTDVPLNIIEPKSQHVVPIGKLKNIRFMSIFRFKVWWTTHWIGSNGKEIKHETQMVILDKNDLGRLYVLLLPLIEGPFRACLQHGVDDYVEMCVESGSSLRSSWYMHVGHDPFGLVKEAMKVIRFHLGTFKLLEEKNPPGIVDKFGWCTWDAFYLKVHPKGVYDGVKGLVEGGCPPGMVKLLVEGLHFF